MKFFSRVILVFSLYFLGYVSLSIYNIKADVTKYLYMSALLALNALLLELICIQQLGYALNDIYRNTVKMTLIY